MSMQNDEYNPLKLRHGFGYDKDEESNSPAHDEAQQANKSRKINKMPFKVLDAP